jgi:hypothetical protein
MAIRERDPSATPPRGPEVLPKTTRTTGPNERRDAMENEGLLGRWRAMADDEHYVYAIAL